MEGHFPICCSDLLPFARESHPTCMLVRVWHSLPTPTAPTNIASRLEERKPIDWPSTQGCTSMSRSLARSLSSHERRHSKASSQELKKFMLSRGENTMAPIAKAFCIITALLFSTADGNLSDAFANTSPDKREKNVWWLPQALRAHAHAWTKRFRISGNIHHVAHCRLLRLDCKAVNPARKESHAKKSQHKICSQQGRATSRGWNQHAKHLARSMPYPLHADTPNVSSAVLQH